MESTEMLERLNARLILMPDDERERVLALFHEILDTIEESECTPNY